ncbi:MAG: SRPBCC family protein [Mycobacterium sp.]|uniref:SRPBCC family protein n=1 Tax=Mycobacterium sp. TaxID=1785 RepID=UPI00261DF990|nr:SRPBCC family protein [Mycobacterium sp.]MDI3313030.1 SRPBCC family protein [Mycobacterium sp.]
MPFVSKTVEVAADAASIMAIVADFESYPQWNEEVKGLWVLARYDDGRPSQLRIDTVVSGVEGTYIQAVYYPSPTQIQTVMQQGDLFTKQEQLFSVVEIGPTSLLTVDMDVEPAMAIPSPMVKKAINNALDYLADNLKKRAEQLAAGW